MKRPSFYRIANTPSLDECKRLELPQTQTCPTYILKDVRAVWTGEKRTPRAGEWYLSGAAVEAYRTKNDLSTPYHIATLVKIRTETNEIEVARLNPRKG